MASAVTGEVAITLAMVARLGADGAVACSSAGVITSPGFAVQVVDAVGAGDAFDAGFIAARLRGRDVNEALRWGNAVAALTIAQPGARSTSGLRELEGFLQQN